MSASQIITTGLSADLVAWLNQYSKSKKRTKRSILEEALSRYRFEAKSREFQKGFAKAAMDVELFELAEMGMGDFSDQLNAFDS